MPQNRRGAVIAVCCHGRLDPDRAATDPENLVPEAKVIASNTRRESAADEVEQSAQLTMTDSATATPATPVIDDSSHA